MYERMLDKNEKPSFEEMLRYSGGSGPLWVQLEAYLSDEFGVSKQIRFPYGNKYGWSVKYSHKSRHICDVFAEKDAYTAHFRIAEAQMNTVLDKLDEYAQKVWDDKYPCGGGGWIHFRVLNAGHLAGLKKIVRAKITAPAK